MFYARINRIKVFYNREDFPGLCNKCAGMWIYTGCFAVKKNYREVTNVIQSFSFKG
ncbi:MAG: hypothetical protein LBK97_06910 [Prevotellaceae bacterium]|nr:hypothetical protein [Prevotellaceae bacterium]